jgi:tetratricopeptide (TPR) repeat protein
MSNPSVETSSFLIQSLEKRIAAKPVSPSGSRLASLYLREGRFDEARVLCEAVVARYPDYATAHLVLGQCYLSLQRTSDARKEFSEALSLQPQCELARTLLRQISATTAADVGLEEEAAGNWMQGSSSQSVEEIVTPTLAEIYAAQGAYQEAIRTYKLLMFRKPQERGRFEQRIRELEEIWRSVTPPS